MGLPEESNNVTVTPGIAVPDAPPPASPARPDNVEPQVEAAGAVTVIVSESEVRFVVVPPATEEPLAATVATALGRSTGPVPEGQGYTAVARRHNSGASPTAVTVAEAAPVDVKPVNSTTKVGSCPVIATLSEDRSTAPLESGWVYATVPSDLMTLSVAVE